MAKFDVTFSQSSNGFNVKIEKPTSALQLCFNSIVEIETKSTPIYEGDVYVVPKADEAQILNTANKKVLSDITISKVPFYEVSNANGKTVYIASEVK